MEKKFLVAVITRMYMPRGHRHDEFVLWYKNTLKDPEATEGVFIEGETVDLIVIHGCAESFWGLAEEYAAKIAARVEEVLNLFGASSREYQMIYLVLHPAAVSREELEEIKNYLPQVGAIYVYSSCDANYIFSALEEINIPEQDKKMIFSYFSDLLKEGWEKYLDPSQSLEEIKRRQRVIKL